MSKKLAKSQEALQQAIALHHAGRLTDSLKAYQHAIALMPNLSVAHEGRGIVLAQLGRLDEALKSLNRAAGLVRNNANIHVNRGNILNELNRFAEALADFDRAIPIDPANAAAHYGRGNALFKLGQVKDSIAAFDRAIALQPGLDQALNSKGIALAASGRVDEALEAYAAALSLNPGKAEYYYNRANALFAMRRLDRALDDYRTAIEIEPDRVDFYLGAVQGCAHSSNLDMAVELCDRVLELQPDCLEAHYWRGNVLTALRRPAEAVESYDRLLLVNPADVVALMERLFGLRSINQWSEIVPSSLHMAGLIESCPIPPGPFTFLPIYDDPALLTSVAGRYLDYISRAAISHDLPPKYARHDRIRLGYFSADFHDHATMHLIAELLEQHDRNRFEVTAFSLGETDGSEWRDRAVRAVDRFIDARHNSDREIAQLAREAEIDIAIDLKGITQYGRPTIFAQRVAPIQVNYLGYPGSMGVSFMDYIIADPIVIPDESRRHYAERVAYLPDSYQPNCAVRRTSTQRLTRADVGLPDRGFVYCCFNQNYKFTPDIFDVWMNILQRVEGSVLWLWAEAPAALDNLRREADERGVDPARLIFAGRMPVAEHLNRIRLADLFLDTSPYNAHTTASDALRMGLPIVTCPGRSFASRVGASLLSAHGVPELIAASLQDYEDLAVELANNPERLDRKKRQILNNVEASALYDSPRYTHNIERLYEVMYERAMNDLGVSDLYLDEEPGAVCSPALT